MQQNVMSEKKQETWDEQQPESSSMCIKPYYRLRLKAIAAAERRTMISYFEEWADEYFNKRKTLLEKLGMEVLPSR